MPLHSTAAKVAALLVLSQPFLSACIAPPPRLPGGASRNLAETLLPADEKSRSKKKASTASGSSDESPITRVLFADPGPRKLYTDSAGNEYWQGRGEVGKFGGTLRLAEFGAGPKTFNGLDTNDVTSHGIGLIQNESLVDYDPWTGKPIPRLAKSFTVSPDGKTVRFVLRKGLKWSDGHPLTADDVVFTYGTVVKEGFGEISHRDTLSVTGDYPAVNKINDLTVDFVFQKPFAPFLYNLNAVMVAPKHVLEPLTRRPKDEFHNFWDINCDPKTMVGSGPFILERYVVGQRYELKRNPYFGMVDSKGQHLPYLDKVSVGIVPEQNTEIMKFLGGELDLLDVKSVRGQDANMLKHKEQQLNFTLYNLGPDDGTYFIILNLSRRKNPKSGKFFVDPVKQEWFNNLDFRKALSHAINRRSIINNVLKGVGYPLYTVETPASLYFDKALKPIDYSLEEAAALLSHGGFVKKDGQLYDAKGNAVEFDLTTNSGNNIRDAVCIIIKEDLKKLGIKAKYQPMEFNAMIDRVHQSLEFEAVMMGLSGSRFEPYGGANIWKSNARMHMFDSRQCKDEKVPDLKDVRPWEKEIDHCLDAAAGTYDEAARHKLYNRFQEIVYEEQPLIFIYTNVMLTAAKNHVGNYRPTPYGSVYYTPKGSMYNLEEIYLKGGQ
ncbi:MAG: ABC transporter substrate-binding protein [Cyanobacteria bacterium REEB67]|nr:ABC transporter substrate-binding protein [Cyanobacteria bacterium REEB67]